MNYLFVDEFISKIKDGQAYTLDSLSQLLQIPSEPEALWESSRDPMLHDGERLLFTCLALVGKDN